MNYTVTLHGHIVEAVVTSCVDVKPDYSTWDSSDDYYGYRELEFDVLSVTDEEDERGLSDQERDAFANEHADAIEDLIWSQIEDGDWYVD